MITCVGWNGNNLLYSVSEKNIVGWNSDGIEIENQSHFKDNQVFITDMSWFPITPGKGQTNANTFVIGATDGK
jgi:hypothetical protein